MTIATTRASYFGGAASEPAGATAEGAGGTVFNREDTLTGVVGYVPVPVDAGTNYSWPKLLALEVTGAGTTAITARQISLAGALPAGCNLHFKDQATYEQPAVGVMPAAKTTDGATPTGYTKVTTSPQTWDNGSVATSGTGRNGHLCEMVLGVDSTFGGVGDLSAETLNDLTFTYAEA